MLIDKVFNTLFSSAVTDVLKEEHRQKYKRMFKYVYTNAELEIEYEGENRRIQIR